MPKLSAAEIQKRARQVRLLVLDVDGVMTDGTLHFDGEGRETKTFHVWDGLAVRLLAEISGVPTAIVSGRASVATQKRAEDLGIQIVHLKSKDKGAALDSILTQLDVEEGEVCAMGDDIVDLPMLSRVGLPISPANGHAEAKRLAVFVTKASGGQGAVREAVELLMKARGDWDKVLARYEG